MGKITTQSSAQTIKFFEDFVRKQGVANFIKRYRKILGIPTDGFPIQDDDIKNLHDSVIPVFHLPDRLFPLKGKTQKEIGVQIVNTCKVFTLSQNINSEYIPILLRMYLFFNTTVPLPSKIFGGQDDLLKMEHLPAELGWYDGKDHYLLKCMYEHFEIVAKKYPIALYINPEASQNQIKDFISKNWSYIVAKRNKNKSTLGSVRKKAKQHRNDFIYENRNLPLAVIRRKLAREYKDKEFLDDGHISKIIQIETKKRN